MKKLGLTLAAITFATAVSHAQLLSWEMSGQPGNQSFDNADTIDPGLSNAASLNSLTRVTLNAETLSNSFNSSGWNTTNTRNDSADYITFTLQPISGNQMSLTTLQYVISGSNTAPGTGQWGYSIGGGTFTYQAPFSIATTASSATWNFTDFTTTQAVEFRFWAYGTTAVNSANPSTSAGTVRITNIAGNDLVLNGSTALVPEPSTYAMMGLGAALLVGIQRFRRKSS